MSKSKRYVEDYLQDILTTITAIESFVKDCDFELFCQNLEKQFAVTRGFEVIGEAVKNIPDSIRNKYTQVPWKDIAGMRDNLIHEYFDANLAIIWKSIEEDLSPLKNIIAQILLELESG